MEILLQAVARFLPFAIAVFWLATCLLVYSYWPDRWWGHDLLSNLLAGSIDVLFTVTLLAWALAKQQKERTRAGRFGAYIECCELLTNFSRLWFDMVKAASPIAPSPGTDLLSSVYVDLLTNHLDLDADAGQYPERNWESRLFASNNENQELVSRLILRWRDFIPPQTLALVLEIEKLTINRVFALLPTARAAQRQMGASPQNGLPFTTDFVANEFRVYRAFSKNLRQQSSEFRRLPGFRVPDDLRFRDELSTLQHRDDIAPGVGSGRLKTPAVNSGQMRTGSP